MKAVPGQLYVLAGLWGQSQLRLHVIRQLRLGITLLFPVDDARLLGEFVPTGAENGRSVAHALLYRHHLPRLFLFTQSYLGYCRHVLRRVTEEGRRRGRSSPVGRGSHQGEMTVFFYSYYIVRGGGGKLSFPRKLGKGKVNKDKLHQKKMFALDYFSGFDDDTTVLCV